MKGILLYNGVEWNLNRGYTAPSDPQNFFLFEIFRWKYNLFFFLYLFIQVKHKLKNTYFYIYKDTMHQSQQKHIASTACNNTSNAIWKTTSLNLIIQDQISSSHLSTEPCRWNYYQNRVSKCEDTTTIHIFYEKQNKKKQIYEQ